ncbi:MAG: thioesterase family protein [Oscillospiraceae bacterium]|nr:thioesterase family protein [Oscillospiraceae bacterium]
MTLQPGIRGSASVLATHENSAAAVGSGALEVFATPSMIALMEKAALESVQPFLSEGEGTVGAEIHVTHDAPTPLGLTVTATAVLVEVDRRRLVFRVEASAGGEVIGKGSHTRFIINSERFLQKAMAKHTQQ